MPQFLDFSNASVLAGIGAAIIILLLFVRGFVKGLRARRRASGDANAEDTRSSHVAFFFDKLDEDSSLPEHVAGLALALGEIEIRRQRDNERHPTFELTRFGGRMLVGLIALSLLGNATLGYAVYRGQMGQRAIAERTTPLMGWSEPGGPGKNEPVEEYIERAMDNRLWRIEDHLASLPPIWLSENLDQLNRMRLAAAKRDTDGDGYVDTKDDCPNIPAGESSSHTFPGCPIAVATDTDQDGAYDFEDRCPDEKGMSASWKGDTTWGGRESGLWGASYLRAETMPEYLASTGSPRDLLRSLHYGCPDKDEDGIVDTMDICPETSAGRYDKDLDGCPNDTTDVSGRWDFYKSPDNWATPERTSRDDHLAFRWWDVTRADGVETQSFYVACLALDVDGKPIQKDAKEFQFGSYGKCYVR